VLAALKAGVRAVARNWGLVVLLLLLNVLLAGALALPLAARLESELQNREAGSEMMYGFDYNFWSEWHDRQSGWAATFGPEIFGIGFAYRNTDLLLKGALPAGLLGRSDDETTRLDPVLLGAGVLFLLVQLFLSGGVLGVLRAPQGGWTVRGLLHGSGFYFGRMLRLALWSLAVLWIVYRLYAPLAGWADGMARDAVSERTAMAWTMGRHALLLLLVLLLNMVSGYAKAILVLEERSSAVLSWVSAVSFCLRRALAVAGHYALVVLATVVLLALWHVLDRAWTTVGYKTQLVTLLLFEAALFGRIFLRLALLGGQVALYRARPEPA
jgi:hypothetical protein